MAAVSDFVSSFHPGSAEHEYHSALERVIASIECDRENPEVGIGLINFLTQCDFIAFGVDTRTHSIAGSREENALFVAHLFEKVNRDSAWWTAQSLQIENAWSKWWENEFRRVPCVEEVFG